MSRNFKKQRNARNSGITLIALIVTIIVILILAGVSIMALTGDNRSSNKSCSSKGKNRNCTNRRRDKISSKCKFYGRIRKNNI